MKYTSSLLGLVVLGFGLWACEQAPNALLSDSQDKVGATVPEQKNEAPTAAEMKALSTEYLKLNALNEALKPSDIHGSQVKTFLDEKAFDAYHAKRYPYAEGTLSVKESYDPTGKIVRLYVMKKIKGYDPENNDWYYAVMSPEGKVSQEGKGGDVGFCISCHAKVKGKDYLFGFE